MDIFERLVKAHEQALKEGAVKTAILINDVITSLPPKVPIRTPLKRTVSPTPQPKKVRIRKQYGGKNAPVYKSGMFTIRKDYMTLTMIPDRNLMERVVQDEFFKFNPELFSENPTTWEQAVQLVNDADYLYRQFRNSKR